MSSSHLPQPASDHPRTIETIAGFMAAAAIFLSLMGLAYRPVRLTAMAALLALIATGIGGRNTRLAGIALLITGICWMIGVTLAIVTRHALY